MTGPVNHPDVVHALQDADERLHDFLNRAPISA